jgi:hypothetical protein
VDRYDPGAVGSRVMWATGPTTLFTLA